MNLADMLSSNWFEQVATATPATHATHGIESQPTVATVATVAVAIPPECEAIDAKGDDADRWCWPHSTAMNTAEIDTFTTRLERFTDKGASKVDAEALADKLVTRDREADDRRLCLECLHLHRAGGWRCGNWLRAGVAMRAKDAQLPGDLVMRLQRCDGFKDMTQ